MPVSKVLLSHERSIFHKQLLDTILSVDAGGIPSNADRSNKLSVQLAQGIHQRILQEVTLHADIAQEQPTTYMKRQKAQGQTSGSIFEEKTMEFLRSTFPKLQHIRPGNWHILKLGNKNAIKTSDFAQYEHLAYLNALVKRDSHLSAALGNDYMVAPDIIVYRDLYTDEELNTPEAIVDDHTAKSAAIRKINGGKPILHASVSAKWTMRSDRAQNSRTEALNLIRNRKGSLPHIVVVTGDNHLNLTERDLGIQKLLIIPPDLFAVRRPCIGGRHLFTSIRAYPFDLRTIHIQVFYPLNDISRIRSSDD